MRSTWRLVSQLGWRLNCFQEAYTCDALSLSALFWLSDTCEYDEQIIVFRARKLPLKQYYVMFLASAFWTSDLGKIVECEIWLDFSSCTSVSVLAPMSVLMYWSAALSISWWSLHSNQITYEFWLDLSHRIEFWLCVPVVQDIMNRLARSVFRIW